MYPEVVNRGIAVSLDFDTTKNAYIVKFKKDKHELTTHLEKKDADECMNGIKCVYRGIQIGQFIITGSKPASPTNKIISSKYSFKSECFFLISFYVLDYLIELFDSSKYFSIAFSKDALCPNCL